MPGPARPGPVRPLPIRLAWFVGLYCASVLVLALVGGVICAAIAS